MLVIFDKDGTIIAGLGDRPANTIAEQVLLPGVASKCAELRAAGHTLAVASNQGGVAWGFITEAEAQTLVAHAAGLIGATDWAMCPHHPKVPNNGTDCNCRKPKPGMLLELMDRLGYSADETIFVGDMESDQQAAEAAGVTFIPASEFFTEDN